MKNTPTLSDIANLPNFQTTGCLILNPIGYRKFLLTEKEQDFFVQNIDRIEGFLQFILLNINIVRKIKKMLDSWESQREKMIDRERGSVRAENDNNRKRTRKQNQRQ